MSIMELENLVCKLSRRVKRLEQAQQISKALSLEPGSVQPDVLLIQNLTAKHFFLTREQMLSPTQTYLVVWPRQIAMWLCRELAVNSNPVCLHLSFDEIGQQFGGRDHGTVMHACEKVKEVLEMPQRETAAVRQLFAEAQAALATDGHK